jgi:hypothetical protein
MRVDFAATVAKEPDDEGSNEDHFQLSVDGSIVALSDGASESFDSRSWAKLLCDTACETGQISPESVAGAALSYSTLYNPTELSWAKAAAHERGSFATLLIVRHHQPRSEIEVVAVGDSVLVLCQERRVTRKFRLAQAQDFDARPELVSTRDELNLFLRDPLFNTQHVAIESVDANTTALLLTDAIGRWCYAAIEEQRDEWLELLKIASAEAFRELVLKARTRGSMRLDDTTLVRLAF